MISLCVFFVGCSRSYVQVPLVPTEPTTGESDQFISRVAPGSEIRLTLKDGRKVKARFEGILDDNLVINEARIQGSPQDSFSEIQQPENQVTSKQYKILLGDIASLEKLEISQEETLRGVLLFGVIAGILYAIVYSMDHAMDDWGE